MRIAMLTNNYKPFVGGVPISIERLSEGLRALGHEVYIFAPTYENQTPEPFVIRYKACERKLKGDVVIPHWFDRDLEYYFEVLSFDMIHVHHPAMSGWLGAYLGKKYNIPVAYTYHTRYEQYLHHLKPFARWEERFPESKLLKGVKNRLIPTYMRNFAKHCDVIFAPTKMMEEVLGEMKVTTPIKVLPTGLENSFFKAKDDLSDAIRKAYIGDKKYLFCSVSRLSKEKNISFMLEGLLQLKARIGDTFRLLLIGDGPERNTLEAQVRKLGLEGNVSFLGSLPNHEIGNYYRACDLFLFASQSETQGIVLLEAMAAHNPVVAIEATGVIDVVKNGYNGYMTSADEKLWVEAIIKAITDEAGLQLLAQGAYQTAKGYGSHKIAMEAATYYHQAIGTRMAVKNMAPKEHQGEEVYYV